MIKEYVKTPYELHKEFPIGSKHVFDDATYEVIGYRDALPTTAFASFPSVEFRKVEE